MCAEEDFRVHFCFVPGTPAQDFLTISLLQLLLAWEIQGGQELPETPGVQGVVGFELIFGRFYNFRLLPNLLWPLQPPISDLTQSLEGLETMIF